MVSCAFLHSDISLLFIAEVLTLPCICLLALPRSFLSAHLLHIFLALFSTLFLTGSAHVFRLVLSTAGPSTPRTGLAYCSIGAWSRSRAQGRSCGELALGASPRNRRIETRSWATKQAPGAQHNKSHFGVPWRLRRIGQRSPAHALEVSSSEFGRRLLTRQIALLVAWVLAPSQRYT